ncbi:SMI1/KNR4 family protein [Nannocystis pusilla]|uniref:SMI1/KNR4 family protein n=1 Tax=Nannocystis pusilla TaxID=889268 RepID=A0A9X3ELG4_9BACT|nr:SMI1/KNR4 family protein [Nannocystis pusilla]MCY1005930.1 SMI1/KNR4 family protein [Nannocystis pusilla]
MPGIESDIERLLLRLVPGADLHWRGASDEEVAQVEASAGHPLPRFYRWFLTRMGHDMGPLAYPSIDFSVQRVLDCSREGLFPPSTRHFMIGFVTEEAMPLHIFYDFAHPARDDARVTRRHPLGGPFHDRFETLHDMLAWGALLRFRVHEAAQTCTGSLHDELGDVAVRLDPVMRSLGFVPPYTAGSHCSLFEREDMVMITTSSSPAEAPSRHVFRLAGPDPAILRSVLGTIIDETPLRLEQLEWRPPLP